MTSFLIYPVPYAVPLLCFLALIVCIIYSCSAQGQLSVPTEGNPSGFSAGRAEKSKNEDAARYCIRYSQRSLLIDPVLHTGFELRRLNPNEHTKFDTPPDVRE